MPVIGSGAGVTSFVHVDDAAGAAVFAIDADTVGIINVTDDEPAAAADWLPYVAARLGAPEPRRLDEETARERLGWQAVHRHTEQRARRIGGCATTSGTRSGIRRGAIVSAALIRRATLREP